ncbi:pyridoxamine 5'-phosphate oxidase family protein [Herbaspirillum sp. LeCh32-8]|uniref:pyridoxamine 5'-phosphate oxidase family protein n=1 Tax=Herbaspirillum sp. LeCh32-8 TaxID=2821356 RepID=UPI001AE14BA8|nr:pyridoxamine 5'-phosphate oxidase family protein [Herbaspirillum sp. LeCh32-8]MBP0600776.1 pyridoxamine 5'-phosphate oxidase family protein [Herbaspirillum sp. LeCh32-8]
MQPATLADIEEHLWQCLAEGAGPGLSPFTMWQLASVGLDGAPQVRTVVLRGIDRASGTLLLHTDLRSAKVAELRRDPRLSLVVCDLPNFRQIRIEGRATIHADDELTRAAWAANRPHSLILYQTPHAPGTPVGTPEAAHVPAGVDPAAGYVNFAVVAVSLSRIEYLDISPGAHRRAVFLPADGGSAHWVAP